jgi:hypothetical protein
MFYLPSILAGTVLLASVILFRKASLGRRKVPPWAAFVCAGAALGGGLGCVAVFDPVALGLPRYLSGPGPAPVRPPMPRGSYREGPLAPRLSGRRAVFFGLAPSAATSHSRPGQRRPMLRRVREAGYLFGPAVG